MRTLSAEARKRTRAPPPASAAWTAEMRQVRQQIDRVDEAIVRLMAKRFALTHRVGELKAEQGEQPLDAERQAQRRRLLAELASRYGVAPQLLDGVFAVVQEEVVKRHRHLAERRQG